MASEEFSEFIELQGDEPLAQGDIIRQNAGDNDIWHRILIVVTADCDLAHRKHGGTLSCVPVLDAPEYLNRFFIAPDMAVTLDRIVAELTEQFHVAQEEAAAEHPFTPLTAKRVREWSREADDPAIKRTLPALNLSRTGPLMAAVRQLEDPNVYSHTRRLDALAGAKSAIGDYKSPADARKSLYKKFASQLSQLPGDAMFLHRLGAELGHGYVAYLRRVVDVDETDVAMNVPGLQEGRHYERIARLASPYVYGLTQRLANVFSSIGMPDNYEKARRDYAAQMSRIPQEAQ